LSNIYFFKERETDSNGSYHFKAPLYSAQITVEEGADISAIIKAYESKNSSVLILYGVNTNSSEIESYTYYANFDYTELGYSGLGTWTTLE
jgi:hypothetical protein